MSTQRKRILVTCHFMVHPPMGGGQVRVFNLYAEIAKHFDVDIIALNYPDAAPNWGHIAPRLRELRVPRTRAQCEVEWELASAVGFPHIGDIVIPRSYRLTPDYMKAMRDLAPETCLIVTSQPYLHYAAREACPGIPIVHDSQNHEWAMKKDFLPPGPHADELLADTAEVEQAACNESQLIYPCSPTDAISLQQHYKFPDSKLHIAPNGVDTRASPFRSNAERRHARTVLGYGHRPLALFIGSWHKPNVDAVQALYDIALHCPEVDFLVLGSVAKGMRETPPSGNIRLLGEVTAEVKARFLEVADIAVNPVVSGSGSNVKMFDYMSSGLPVVTTRFGMRGSDFVDGEHVCVAELDEFPEAIRHCLALGDDLANHLSCRARALIEERYDWRRIAQNLLERLRSDGLL